VKITKLPHACLVVEQDGAALLVDPGSYVDYERDLAPFVGRAVGVVVTHVHGDHFSPDHIAKILAARPGLPVVATSDVAAQLPGATVWPGAGGSVEIGPFHVDFFGGLHHDVGRPTRDENFGIVVNGLLAYPGDSYDVPPTTPAVLAIPTGGPWARTLDAIAYLAAVRPTAFGFGVHDIHLSEVGQQMTAGFMGRGKAATGSDYRYVPVGGSFEV
jgi:L-ascorbate metabolism protein UlaG (beta-lactamase superfamily)